MGVNAFSPWHKGFKAFRRARPLKILFGSPSLYGSMSFIMVNRMRWPAIYASDQALAGIKPGLLPASIEDFRSLSCFLSFPAVDDSSSPACHHFHPRIPCPIRSEISLSGLGYSVRSSSFPFPLPTLVPDLPSLHSAPIRIFQGTS